MMPADREREKKIREFLAGTPFGRRNISDEEVELFDIALTHDSYANEEASRGNKKRCYERLEFLGDAVLQLAVCEHVYSNTDLSEGQMTEFKKGVVCNKNISARISEAGIDIDGTLLVGEGHREKRTGSNLIEDNMRADAFEALLGAIYLLYGTDEAKRIVREVFLR